MVKCDERGRYSVDKGESFESINLIEFLFSDTEASLKHYLIIASRIARKINWQLVDEDTNEILVEKNKDSQHMAIRPADK